MPESWEQSLETVEVGAVPLNNISIPGRYQYLSGKKKGGMGMSMR